MNYDYSVIIPVYNAGKTIERCMDSLVTQAEGLAEIILVNDGSTDNSADLCRSYAEEYDNVVLVYQDNAGASKARNRGLDMAKGTYITFVDSDDYVSDQYFNGLNEFGDEDFAVFSNCIVSEHSITVSSLPECLLKADNHYDRIMNVIKGRIAGPWNKRFKREIIEEYHLRFHPDLVIGEDFVFGLEYMLCCSSSAAMDLPLYFVDETGCDSVTRGYKYDYSQFLRIYDYAFPAIEQADLEPRYCDKLLGEVDFLYCRTAFAACEHLRSFGNSSLKIQKQLIEFFYEECRQEIKPINLTHRIMKQCILNKNKMPFDVVAVGHSFIRRTKRAMEKRHEKIHTTNTCASIYRWR